MQTELVFAIRDTLVYFVIATIILLLGFGVLDLLTPGKLYRAVFVDHLPNAALIASGQIVGLAIIVITAVLVSPATLIDGALEVAVIGLLGILLQALSLVVMELLIPGRFRDLVLDRKPRAGAAVASLLLVVLACVNAACLT
ncbi:DUF350 domain-containing protein [Staphylococcus chromogenes]|nr:DUF350 domain-containing protein [Staphylococcus chromogenes]